MPKKGKSDGNKEEKEIKKVKVQNKETEEIIEINENDLEKYLTSGYKEVVEEVVEEAAPEDQPPATTA